MITVQPNKILSFSFSFSLSRSVALGLALGLGACATGAPAAPSEPPASVAASVQALRYGVEVAAVDADTDLGDIGGMVTQALIEGGYAIAQSKSDADIMLVASLTATRSGSGMTVVVNGEERVQRDMKLTLRAQSPSDDRVVDQTTRAFSSKEPRVPPAEVAAAVNKLGAGGLLETYAVERVAHAKEEAEAKAKADAKAEADAAAAEELAAKTKGCRQLDDSTTQGYLQAFRTDKEISFEAALGVYGSSKNWCDVEGTKNNLELIFEGSKNPPSMTGGESSPKLTALAKKKFIRTDFKDAEFVRAVATAKRKRLLNEFGVSMGTTRRVAVVASIGGGAACFEFRADWRVSTLIDDQDDPEYVKFDWNGSSLPARLVACPKR